MYNAKEVKVSMVDNDICELINQQDFPITQVGYRGTFCVYIKKKTFGIKNISNFIIEWEDVCGKYMEIKTVDFDRIN